MLQYLWSGIKVFGPVITAQTITPVGPASWVEIIQTTGLVGSLILFLYGFKAEWWVTGEVYRRRLKEVDAATSALDKHRDRVEEQTIPLLVRAADTLSQVVTHLETRE